MLLPKFLILSISSNYPILSIALAQEDILSVMLALKSLVEVLSIMLILHFGSILSGAQYVNLQKYFLHLSLVIYFFPTLPIKLKPRLQLGGRLLVSNHLDQSLDQEEETLPLPIRNREQQVKFITLFSGKCQALKFGLPFTSLSKLCTNAGPKMKAHQQPKCSRKKRKHDESKIWQLNLKSDSFKAFCSIDRGWMCRNNSSLKQIRG